MLNLKVLETWACFLWELWLRARAQDGCPRGPQGLQLPAAWEETWFRAHFGLCEPEKYLN